MELKLNAGDMVGDEWGDMMSGKILAKKSILSSRDREWLRVWMLSNVS